MGREDFFNIDFDVFLVFRIFVRVFGIVDDIDRLIFVLFVF